MRGRLFSAKEHLNQSLWFIPTVAILLAVVAAEAAGWLDSQISASSRRWYVFSGGPDTARAVVMTIATSMITFTGLVFSITMLVLQLSSAQLSPRVMRTFLRDRMTQVTLGVFIATFTYSLAVLRRVGGSTESAASIAIWVSLVLVACSVVLFVFYIHHIAQSVRPVTVIGRIKAETVKAIEQTYPTDAAPMGAEPPGREHDTTVEMGDRSGVLVDISLARLREIVDESSLVVELLHPVGEFVTRRGALMRVWGTCPAETEKALRGAVTLGPERTMSHDPAFGIRQLVDVAIRALSPGINDPTSAVQVLDALQDVLIMVLDRPTTELTHPGGDMRVFLRRPGWESLVTVSVDEIRQYGGNSSQVLIRLHALLMDLLERAPEDRKPVLRRELALVNDALDAHFGRERGRLEAPGVAG